jgi:hypothetical protein
LFSDDVNLKTYNIVADCPGGEIGRRTVFRSQHPQGCAGSNPVPGTKNLLDEIEGVFAFMSVMSLLIKANECKNPERRRREEVFVQPLVGVSGSQEHAKHAQVIQSRALIKPCISKIYKVLFFSI